MTATRGGSGPSAPADVPWWEAPAGGPGEVVVVAETPPPRGRLRRARVVWVVAVAGLAVVASAWMALDAGRSESGAEGAEAAVLELIDAVEAGDLVGVVALIEPAERDTLGRSVIDVVGELQRLGVLDPDLDLSGVEGVGLSFGEVTTRREPVTDDIVDVIVTSSSVSAHLVIDQPPLGPLVVDRIPSEARGDRVVSEPGPRPETVVATVRRHGRWYVSALYTAAELARRDNGQPLPIGDLAARGASDPGGAVRGFVDAAVAFDPRGVLARLAPDEAAVLYDYAGLYLPGLEEAAARALASARDGGWQWSVDGLEFGVDSEGDRAVVTLTAARATVAGSDTVYELVMAGGSSRLDWSVTDSSGRPVAGSRVLVDAEGCVTVSSTSGSGASPEAYLDGDPARILAPPELDLDGDGRVCRDETSVLGNLILGVDPVRVATEGRFVTRRVDGSWYVSPLETAFGQVLDVLGHLEPDDVEEWLDLVASARSEDQVLSPFDGADPAIPPDAPTTTLLMGTDPVGS